MAESAEGEEPDWNALLTEDDNTPEKPSEEDATQKKKLNAVKKKKLDYVDIAGKLILFPFFLFDRWKMQAYNKKKQYRFYAVCSFLLVCLMAVVIMGMGVGGAGQTAGIVGLFGISMILFAVQILH